MKAARFIENVHNQNIVIPIEKIMEFQNRRVEVLIFPIDDEPKLGGWDIVKSLKDRAAYKYPNSDKYIKELIDEW